MGGGYVLITQPQAMQQALGIGGKGEGGEAIEQQIRAPGNPFSSFSFDKKFRSRQCRTNPNQTFRCPESYNNVTVAGLAGRFEKIFGSFSSFLCMLPNFLLHGRVTSPVVDNTKYLHT